MTEKDLKKVEKMIEDILHDMLCDVEPMSLEGNDEAIFPMTLLQEMEDYLGHPIDFMAIS